MKKFAIFLFLLAAALSACQVLKPADPTATPLPPTPTPPPPKELTVCLGAEPESLFLYTAASRSARDVLQAIYDGPVDVVDGVQVPVILESIPNLSDGSAFFSPAGVATGDEVINSAGHLVSLRAGVQVFPSGCTSPDCAVTYDGTTPIQMDTLTANFKLKPGLVWSDGQPLTASDSVYSFEIASDPVIPADWQAVDRTAAYIATDDLTVQWTSKPGLAADGFGDYFWQPLPRHAWGGLEMKDLLVDETANRAPIGWGPYMIENWKAGESIRLLKNPAYFRAAESLPYFDILNFKFIDRLQDQTGVQSVSEQCDIVSGSALSVTAMTSVKGDQQGLGYNLVVQESGILQMLAFGIKPLSYDDNYYPYGGSDRVDLFGEPGLRQALLGCIDRQAIVDELLGSLTGISTSYLPSAHPLVAASNLNAVPFDPGAAKDRLQALGWVDMDLNPETPLVHGGNIRIPYGTPLEMTLLSSTAGLQSQIAARIAADLKNCGAKVSVSQVAPAELFLPGPEGPVFGRKFDLALIPWDTGNKFDCGFFETAEIPAVSNMWLGDLAGGANFYGYSNPAFDAQCERLKNSGLDKTLSSQSTAVLLQILSEDLPFLPLFHFPEGYLLRITICAPESAKNEAGLFAAIESLKGDGGC